ncbi:MAG: twin-arginine translocase TatA/TatE family subunit [Eubacteriaceae bacterium]
MRIGMLELLVILIVALLVLGPEKMPLYAQKTGKFLNTLKDYTGKLTKDIQENIVEPFEEVQKPIKEATEPLTNITDVMTKPVEEMKKSINSIGKASNKDVVDSENDESTINIQVEKKDTEGIIENHS